MEYVKFPFGQETKIKKFSIDVSYTPKILNSTIKSEPKKSSSGFTLQINFI